MIRSGSEYLEAIRDGRRVVVEGRLIQDVTTHPRTRDSALAMAACYDLHLDPEHASVATFADASGERWAKRWWVPCTQTDLEERRAYDRLLLDACRPGGSATCRAWTLGLPRELSHAAMCTVFVNGERRAWEYLMRGDLWVSSAPPASSVAAPEGVHNGVVQPAALRTLRESADGVVLGGWCAVGPDAPLADVIAVQVPPGAAARHGGVLLAIVSVNETRVTQFLPGGRISGQDGMAFLDEVVVPWRRVFEVGSAPAPGRPSALQTSPRASSRGKKAEHV